MPLYRWNADNLEPVPSTTFETERLMERGDLQRMLRDQPEALEAGLFIVAEEYGNWQDSGRSIDLLALDDQYRLVVIELKRTQSGDHSELQAIRYAAMVSNMTLEKVIDAHRDYLKKRDINEDARDRILNYLEADDESDAEIHTGRPRIILASAGFSTELTTSVLWLRGGGIDISCVKLQLYNNGDGLLMDTNQIIPLPEASDYLVKARENVEAGHRQRRGSRADRTPGADAFLDAIDKVREEYKPMLNQLLDWAVELEEEKLAILETRLGGVRGTLRIRLPNANVRPVVIHQQGGNAYYNLRSDEIRARAPEADARIAQILGAEAYGGNQWSLPDGLLDALTDAYREASGQPATPTPPPDTAPHTPPPAA